MSIDEVMDRTIEYGLMMRKATVYESRALNAAIRAAINQHVAEAVAAETERCIKACRSVVDAGPENGCCPTFWNEGAEECEKAIRAGADRDEVTR
jgi:hypothetical protein